MANLSHLLWFLIYATNGCPSHFKHCKPIDILGIGQSITFESKTALIGDAAHSIHPMAGQGMNMGFNDAAHLANTVIKNMRTGNDFGCPQALDDYESQAKIMNYTTAVSMEGIKKLYEATSFEPFNIVRNVGASLIHQVDPLKSLLQQQASNHPLSPKKYEWENTY